MVDEIDILEDAAEPESPNEDVRSDEVPEEDQE
jgi:hypothetical protein